MEKHTEKITIKTEYIKLDQLLKFAGVADIGSDAKAMILDGIVDFNGEPCTMRGKKIRNGDVVEVHGDDITIRLEVSGPAAVQQ